MRADTLIEEYRHFDSATHAAVTAAINAAEIRALGLMLEEASFRAAANEPTERQVFEHTIAIVLAPLHGVQWDDVGAWNAGYQISDRDGDGNLLHGDVIAMDTKNSLIQSQGRLVAVIGMQDTIVIDTPDAVLVAHRSHAQSVKQLVERLKAAKRSEVASQTAHDTPWGRIETIASDAAQDMRIMTVHPGGQLVGQRHRRRPKPADGDFRRRPLHHRWQSGHRPARPIRGP